MMNKLRIIAILIVVIILFADSEMPISANMFTPSHACSKPYKPYEFSSEWEYRNFLNSVERYKNCISDFVDEQYEAVKKHQNAAEEAVDEWNNYVAYELN